MAFGVDSRAAIPASILITASLAFFGTGLHPAWPLLWIAPLPVLLIARRLSAPTAFVCAAAAWFLGYSNMWRYVRNILGTPARSVGTGLLLMALPSCAFGLCVLLTRALQRRGAPYLAALSFPAAWVGFEYLSMVSSPHGTFGNIAYTQMDALPLLQLAAVTGIWGISFCVFLLPSTLAVLADGDVPASARRVLAAATGGLLLAVLAFGLWRLHYGPGSAQPSVRVGLIASDLQENVLPVEPEDAGRLYRDYLDHANGLVSEGAKVIILPEKLAVTVDPGSRTGVDATFQAFADRSRSTVVVGVIRVAAPAKFNEARIYSPSGAVVLTYDKEHMLPAFESKLRPGTSLTELRESSGLWGVAICKDLDFPQLARRYGANGIGLLLAPAWDFDDDAWLHNRMAVMRGVESGFGLARVAKQGLLTVSDRFGRVLAEKPSSAAPFATLVFDAPASAHQTPYVMLGDWFAWVILATLSVMIATLLRRVRAPTDDTTATSRTRLT